MKVIKLASGLTTAFLGMALLVHAYGINSAVAQCTPWDPAALFADMYCIDAENGPGCTTVGCTPSGPSSSWRRDGQQYETCGDPLPQSGSECELCKETIECAILKEYGTNNCSGVASESPEWRNTCRDN